MLEAIGTLADIKIDANLYQLCFDLPYSPFVVFLSQPHFDGVSRRNVVNVLL